MPSTDVRAAAEVVVGECRRLPFLPELADRGLGSDLLGRTGALLADMPVDVSTRAWRLSDSRGRAGRRAADLLDRDTDALEEAWERARGVMVDLGTPVGGGHPTGQLRADLPSVQLRVTGPWSLSAALELPAGRVALTDPGARRDVAASLAEGAAAHVVRLASRMGTRSRILLDEPELWRVVAGTVPGVTELDTIAAVPAERVGLALRRFADTVRSAGVDEVVVRGPGRPGPDAPAAWSALTDTARGETPLDGLAVRVDDLVARTSREGVADRDAHRALDAVGTVLGDGGLVHLEGPQIWVGMSATPTDGPGTERVVAGLLEVLDRVAAPRYASLARLTLAPTVAEMTGSVPDAVSALAGVRRVAEAAPALAE